MGTLIQSKGAQRQFTVFAVKTFRFQIFILKIMVKPNITKKQYEVKNYLSIHLAPHWGECPYTTVYSRHIERISQYNLREKQEIVLAPTLLATDPHSPWLLFPNFGLRFKIHLNYESIVLLRLLRLLVLSSLNRRKTWDCQPDAKTLIPTAHHVPGTAESPLISQ